MDLVTQGYMSWQAFFAGPRLRVAEAVEGTWFGGSGQYKSKRVSTLSSKITWKHVTTQ